MKMHPEEVNKHINTILRQDEIVKFLSERENINPQSTKDILDTFLTETHEGKCQVLFIIYCKNVLYYD